MRISVWSLLTVALVTLGCTPRVRRAVPSEAVAWEVFARYLIANVWPHAVTRIDEESFAHVPPAREDEVGQAAAAIHSGECLGPIYRGRGLIEAPEDRLLQAGCELVKQLPDVPARIREHLDAASAEHPARPEEPVGGRLRTLRRAAAEATARDAELKRRVCGASPQLISDC